MIATKTIKDATEVEYESDDVVELMAEAMVAFRTMYFKIIDDFPEVETGFQTVVSMEVITGNIFRRAENGDKHSDSVRQSN